MTTENIDPAPKKKKSKLRYSRKNKNRYLENRRIAKNVRQLADVVLAPDIPDSPPSEEVYSEEADISVLEPSILAKDEETVLDKIQNARKKPWKHKEAIRARQKEKDSKPKPIQLSKGYDHHNAYVILRRQDEIAHILESLYGKLDGDYFVQNEALWTDRKTREKYKILNVEDKNGFHYILWFNVTQIGPYSY